MKTKLKSLDLQDVADQKLCLDNSKWMKVEISDSAFQNPVSLREKMLFRVEAMWFALI